MSSDVLIKRILADHRPGLYCYVLLDPLAAAENSLMEHLASALGEQALTRVYRPDLPSAPTLHPVLVCLSSADNQPCTSLLEMTALVAQQDLQRRKRYVCGWLLSEANPTALARHLTALCRLPDGSGSTTCCPIFEPLRLELLAAMSDRAQGPWWPIDRWVFLSSGGSLATLKGNPQAARGLPANALRIQGNVPLIEAVLAVWRSVSALSGATNAPVMPPFAAVRTSNHIDDARGLGLSEGQDIQVLALHMLCFHPKLHTLQVVLDMVNTAINQQRTLAPMLAQYSDPGWQRLVATLPRSEAYP
ncbi:hypothetical protein ACIQUF_10450 [Pseudomonas sp. NPDC090233]|uniref:hypothetical protein n=1 Tax=Pseudomonas sp. NPDC090233 TaxID=3364479 RepID=UPI00383A59C2